MDVLALYMHHVHAMPEEGIASPETGVTVVGIEPRTSKRAASALIVKAIVRLNMWTGQG